MELTKKLVLEDNEVDSLYTLLGEMPSGVMNQLVDEGKIKSDQAMIISDIYAALNGEPS